MSLIKKDFKRLADILKTSETKEDITEKIISFCNSQNKLFDEEIFRKALK